MMNNTIDFFLHDTCDTIVKTKEVTEQLNLLETQADNGGFTAAEFAKLAQVVQEKKMPAQVSRRFILCLVPNEPVSGRTLGDLVMYGLGCSNLNLNYVVNPILQVLNQCLDYDLVQQKRPLNALYELFLSELRNSGLCDTIALILAKITTLHDVDARRANVIKECYNEHGGTASLNMLRYRIRQLRPDLEPTYSPPSAGRPSINATLNKRFRNIFDENGTGVGGTSGTKSGIGWELGQLTNKLQYKDRQRQCLLPTADTINMQGGLQSQKNKKIPVQSIESTAEGLLKLEKLDLPNNILSLLPTQLAKFILPRKDLRERFSLNLYYTLQKEFFCLPPAKSKAEHDRKYKRQKRFLEVIANFQTGCFHGLPVIGRFLSEYLTEWDGETFYYEILGLLKIVQMTNFKEIYDTLMAPLESFMHKFTISDKLLLVDAYFGLLRYWATIELSRLTTETSPTLDCLFPDSTQIGADEVLTQIFLLIDHITEVTLLILSTAREEFSPHMVCVTRFLMDFFITTQEMFVRQRVPVLLEIPQELIHADIYSFSSLGLSKVCKYLLDQKKHVMPMLKERALTLETAGKSSMAKVIKHQISSKELTGLEVVTRDVLMILSPTIVFKTEDSVFSRPGLNEDDLIRALFMSEHPSFLSLTMAYFKGRPAAEARRIWSGLSSDRVYGTQSQDNPIFSNVSSLTAVGGGASRGRVNSAQFYRGNSRLSGLAAISNPEVDSYLKFLGEQLPDIGTFFYEFWCRPEPGRSIVSSAATEATESSGVFTMDTNRFSENTTTARKPILNPKSATVSSKKKRKIDTSQDRNKSLRSKRTVLGEIKPN